MNAKVNPAVAARVSEVAFHVAVTGYSSSGIENAKTFSTENSLDTLRAFCRNLKPRTEANMSEAVFCIARSEGHVLILIDQLRSAGFSSDDISVLFPDTSGPRGFAHEQQARAPEGAVTGAGTGSVLGGAGEWLVGVGALAVPGMGSFIAAGPMMAALSGAAGGVAEALIGMDIPDYEARRYEGKLREGNILISVHSENFHEADYAKVVFERAGADNISWTTGAGAKGRKIESVGDA
jgi:hypothetical protein